MRFLLSALILLGSLRGVDPQSFSIIQIAGGSIGVGGGANLRQSNVFGVPNTVDPSQYYRPGLTSQAISTADWYYSDGFYWPRPFDLSGNGTEGATLTSQGKRYFWPITADHPTGSPGNWSDGQEFWGGFSGDPQTLPQSVFQVAPSSGLGNNTVTNQISTAPYGLYHLGHIAYEPNDTANGAYRWFGEGQDYGAQTGLSVTGTTTSGQPTVTGISSTANLAYSAAVTGSCVSANTSILRVDSASQITLNNSATSNGSCSLNIKNPSPLHVEGAFTAQSILGPWTLFGPTHYHYLNVADFSSYQVPARLGPNNWTSYGLFYMSGKRVSGPPGDRCFGPGVWTDTSLGLAFTRPDPPQTPVNRIFNPTGCPTQNPSSIVEEAGSFTKITIAGQDYICTKEDRRGVTISSANPAVVRKPGHGYASGTPVYFENAAGELYSGTFNNTNTIIGVTVNQSGGSLTHLSVGQQISWMPFATNGQPLVSGVPTNTTITNISGTTLTLSNAVSFSGSSAFLVWTLPPPILPDVNYYVHTVVDANNFTISTTPGTADISTARSNQAGSITMPAGGMYVSRVAVDARMNMLASPAPVHISNAYSGIYPGPTYLQAVGCYLESGILTYYATRGFFPSLSNFGFAVASPYTSGNHQPYNNGGALWQEMVDIYSEIVDPVAAMTAAPMGFVISSVANGVVTFKWNDVRPNQKYRLYYGFSQASQPFLIGDCVCLGETYSPYLQTPNVMYFKLVSLDNNNVGQGSRVVHSWVSNYGALVNAHMTRLVDDGGDPATFDSAKFDTIINWLSSHNHFNAMQHGVGAGLGVKRNSSGKVFKSYDLGTTMRPGRNNDVWYCAMNAATPPDCVASLGNASYSPTQINNTTSAVAIPTGTYGVFGGLNDANGRNGRLNPIRRQWSRTVIASYQKKSASGTSTLLAMGQFGGLGLQHVAGTPDTIQFYLTDDVQTQTATVNLSGSSTAPHVVAGTFGATGNLWAYSDGVAGMQAQTGLHVNSNLSLLTTLRGNNGGDTQDFVMNIGSQNSRFDYGTPTGQYRMLSTSTGIDLDTEWDFEDEWSAADIAAFTTLLTGYTVNAVSGPLHR
jgi:hypothetical protein